jgi:hypothetical protein
VFLTTRFTFDKLIQQTQMPEMNGKENGAPKRSQEEKMLDHIESEDLKVGSYFCLVLALHVF